MPQSAHSSHTVRSEFVTIEKLVYGGDGLGRLDSGEVIFVPWSAPGDKLRVSVLPGSQKPLKGQILEIIEPAPERVEPRCSVFGQCGGCQWQHLPHSTQRDWKQRIVQESLMRLGKLPDAPVLDTFIDPEKNVENDKTAWHFRNRVQWEVQQNPETHEIELGYLKAHSHDVIAFETCWIIPPLLNQLANWLQRYFKQKNSAFNIKRIEARQNSEGQILLNFETHGSFNSNSSNHSSGSKFVQDLSEAFPQISGITAFDTQRKQQQVLVGESAMNETILHRTFKVSAGSFFQTNQHATEQILKILDQWILPHSENLLELYAGVGLFSIYFQQKAKRIVAVEAEGTSVQDAEENIRQARLPHIQYLKGDVQKVLKKLDSQFEVAIVDPPRAGCTSDVLEWLSQHVSKQLLYVSCNPTTLARDLKTLVTAGWQIRAVQPLDMFPQTYHVETIVDLRRKA